MLSQREMEVTSDSTRGDDKGSQAGNEPCLECYGCLDFCPVVVDRKPRHDSVSQEFSVKIPEQQIVN